MVVVVVTIALILIGIMYPCASRWQLMIAQMLVPDHFSTFSPYFLNDLHYQLEKVVDKVSLFLMVVVVVGLVGRWQITSTEDVVNFHITFHTVFAHTLF